MEVAVRGFDGATHLILCTGVACLESLLNETYTFLVGPQLVRRQFVGATASGALSTIQAYDKTSIEDNARAELSANLVSIDANFNDASGQVRVRAEVSSSTVVTKLSISYSISILAELSVY